MNVIVEGIQFTRQTSQKAGRQCHSEACDREIAVGDVYYRVAKANATVLETDGRGRGSRRKISGPRAQEQGFVSTSEKVEIFHEQCFIDEFCAPEA